MGKGRFEIKLARVVVYIQPRHKTLKRTTAYITCIYSVHTSQRTLCVSITKTSIKAARGNISYFIRNAGNTNALCRLNMEFLEVNFAAVAWIFFCAR